MGGKGSGRGCDGGSRRDRRAGSNRVAESGAWLGGGVPYGYRKQRSSGKARLVLSDEPIAPNGLSEPEVIRTIFRMAAVDKQSCRRIADHLNGLGVPCTGSLTEGPSEKQLARTGGSWRAGRVRNLLVSSTYKGRHAYGKRSRNPLRRFRG